MIRKTILTALAAFLLCSSLHADQFAYLDAPLAQRAHALLSKEKEAYFLCEPCGEKTGRVTTVHQVENRDAGYQAFREIYINGEAVDLAYTYVRRGNRWKNAALLLGEHPKGVSIETP
ncbi:MAG TPA: hypothetical protein PLY93_05630 [Turneriella sp.]|nr:hypothetical protein [Turneriella sp.]